LLATKTAWTPGLTGAQRTATWSQTGLTPGYYKVEVFYQRHSGNAKDLLIQYKSTRMPGFLPIAKRLDQTIGTPSTTATTPTNGYLPVYQNVTPFSGGITTSYIKVERATGTTGNTGTLSVRLSDHGTAVGKVMMADCIRLTLMQTIVSLP
jgi:hypothetical protein